MFFVFPIISEALPPNSIDFHLQHHDCWMYSCGLLYPSSLLWSPYNKLSEWENTYYPLFISYRSFHSSIPKVYWIRKLGYVLLFCQPEGLKSFRLPKCPILDNLLFFYKHFICLKDSSFHYLLCFVLLNFWIILESWLFASFLPFKELH